MKLNLVKVTSEPVTTLIPHTRSVMNDNVIEHFTLSDS